MLSFSSSFYYLLLNSQFLKRTPSSLPSLCTISAINSFPFAIGSFVCLFLLFSILVSSFQHEPLPSREWRFVLNHPPCTSFLPKSNIKNRKIFKSKLCYLQYAIIGYFDFFIYFNNFSWIYDFCYHYIQPKLKCQTLHSQKIEGKEREKIQDRN